MSKDAPKYQTLGAEAARLRAEGLSVREVARRLGVGFLTARRALAAAGVGTADAAAWNEDGDTATWSAVTKRPVRTLDDAVKAARVDLDVWYVDRWECSQWTVVTKDTDDNPVQSQNWRVKVYLRRLQRRCLREAQDALFERMKKHAPKWPKLKPPRAGKGRQFLAVPALFDVHFGKLAWHEETGENYDVRIAESLYYHAVEDLAAECRQRPVVKILLPFGNDWLHIEGRGNATTRGTAQDVDGRLSKVFKAAMVAAVRGVEAFATIAPVEVVLVPGNHDRTLAECLCHVIDARFHGSDRVTVDVSPITRKYVRWGTSLIGLAHGDMVRPEKLPGLMPAEAKRDWAETTCHEWLTGHGHRSQKWTTLDTDTQQGTVVRQLRALTRSDLWHFDYGFVGTAPAAECYFYERAMGYAGHSVIPARTQARRCG